MLLLFLLFIYPYGKIKEHPLAEKLYELSQDELQFMKQLTHKSANPSDASLKGSPYESEETKVNIDAITRDDSNRNIEEILKERNFDREKFDAAFKNMKKPIIPKTDSAHSTFGRDIVYIYHTHSRESFLPYFPDTNNPLDAYHPKANITLVGEMLGKALERKGVGAQVDSADIVQELDNRNWDFTNSYKISGERMKSARGADKDLAIFLDIHRDSLRKKYTTEKLNGEDFAKILFIVGTGHKDYEKNLQFTEGLQARLSQKYPGLSKGIITKDRTQGNGVYNQELSPNSVIVEVGGVDNTFDEMNRSTEALADVLSDYYWHNEE